MKIKHLALAVATSLFASQAFALNNVVSASATLQLNISGSTAADIQVQNFYDDVCVAGTVDVFKNPADTARATSCNIAAGKITGIAANTTALFRKESGGSATGINPVANNTTLPGIDLSTCTDANNDKTWDCSNTTVQVPAEVGIADVEPELFSISENSIGAFNPAAFGANVYSANIQTFGIVVTEDLRNGLQAAQGLTSGSDDVSQMPSLSSAIVANIFAGNVSSWQSLVNNAGVSIVTNSSDVEICQRAGGSGTQAQFNSFYFGLPCLYRGASSKAFLGFSPQADLDGINNNIINDDGFGGTSSPAFHLQVGSSDMGRCLTNLAAANRTAIGIQAVEKVAESNATRNKFKYIKIDGAAPTLENVQRGLYKNVAALSLQWRATSASCTVASGCGFSTAKTNTAAKLVELTQKVAPVAGFNANLVAATYFPSILDATRPNGRADVGALAFAGKSGNPNYTGVFNATTPVIGLDKATGLSSPSSCAILRPIGPVHKINVAK